jgi:MFS transporter, DHA2 family, multidrug resistance protein
MPIIGYLTSKIDARKLLGAGILGSAAAMFILSRLSLDVGFWNFWWPLTLQGAALGLIFVPLTTVTNDPIPRERMGNATSIFNLMRNIGASIGISMVETIQFRKQQMNINVLGRHMSSGNLQAQRMIHGMTGAMTTRGFDATAARKAYGMAWAVLQRQAAMLAYNDTFLFLAIMFAVMFPLIFMIQAKARRTRHGPLNFQSQTVALYAAISAVAVTTGAVSPFVFLAFRAAPGLRCPTLITYFFLISFVRDHARSKLASLILLSSATSPQPCP